MARANKNDIIQALNVINQNSNRTDGKYLDLESMGSGSWAVVICVEGRSGYNRKLGPSGSLKEIDTLVTGMAQLDGFIQYG